jgi:aspartate aminotransferase-like enzyme
MSPNAALRVKIASEDWEFEQIHRLNHDTFAEEIPQHPASSSRRLVDKFHDENIYVIGLDGQRLAGMIALRTRRPFSLDQRLQDLDSYLPAGRSMCELRLLAVEKSDRRGRVLPSLLDYLWRYCVSQGFDLALISGITRQLKLYRRLGFKPFGPLVGTPVAQFQPMMITLERFAPAAGSLFRGAEPASRAPALSFLPGPVAVHDAVRGAFQAQPQSHRGANFVAALTATKTRACELAGTARAEILLGSGTTANDAIAGQLSLDAQPGVVLTNGEFGERLVDHARRFRLLFDVIAEPWGTPFGIARIGRRLNTQPAPGWLWFAHCETSTGMLNDLAALKALCSAARVRMCVDAVSSIGTVPLDLAGAYFASGVSGKALGAYPGLALVFYNHQVSPAPSVLPRSLDLGLYAAAHGVPFTHSSNLVWALHQALRRVQWPERFRALADTSAFARSHLQQLGFDLVVTDRDAAPAIVTIALPSTVPSCAIAADLERLGYLVSANSRYLIERNWIQIGLMGDISRDDVTEVSTALIHLCGDRIAATPAHQR